MSNEKPITIVRMQDAKDIARTISNKTSQAIINHVKKNKGSTATEIAKALDIPASTTHYNITALVKAKILDDELFHYSSKGKQVSHYEVSNQVIIIIPDSESTSFGTQLKSLLPGVLGAVIITGVWSASKIFNSASKSFTSSEIASDSLNQLSGSVGDATPKMLKVAASSPDTSLAIIAGIGIGVGIIVIGTLIYFLIKHKKTINK